MCPPVSPCGGASIVKFPAHNVCIFGMETPLPARAAPQGHIHRSFPHTMRVFLAWKRHYADVRAGTQAPPLPISIIFFHTILHKQKNHLHAIRPKETNRPCAIHPYPSPPNHTVCPYPIGVILSIAQGWQVQRSLPWVTVRARRLPPWGLYSFSSHIITTHGE